MAKFIVEVMEVTKVIYEVDAESEDDVFDLWETTHFYDVAEETDREPEDEYINDCWED